MRSVRHRLTFTALLTLLAVGRVASAGEPTDEVNLLSWDQAAGIVGKPLSESSNGQWSADALLDELPDTGWANPRHDLTPKVIVFEMQVKSRVVSLVFDTAQAYSRERSARNVTVEISDRKDGGFVSIAKPQLEAAKDGQKFVLAKPAVGRYLKLTVLDNYGDSQFMEIMNVKAYGRPLSKAKTPELSGTFTSDYGDLHLLAKGSAAYGCYMRENGLVENGGFEGRVLRFTWSADETRTSRWSGPALMIFSEDGQSFVGHFWHGNTEGKDAPRDWNGTRKSQEIGFCPNWKPDQGNEVESQLKREGRARLYGILFDTDSDHIKEESKSTLDSLLAATQNQAQWSFAIEGHTDNVGIDAHNQTLSEKRAAAVKAWLVKAGVDAGRLTTQGFGSSKPVASNETSVGRSQNRRVEVVNK